VPVRPAHRWEFQRPNVAVQPRSAALDPSSKGFHKRVHALISLIPARPTAGTPSVDQFVDAESHPCRASSTSSRPSLPTCRAVGHAPRRPSPSDCTARPVSRTTPARSVGPPWASALLGFGYSRGPDLRPHLPSRSRPRPRSGGGRIQQPRGCMSASRID